MDRGEMGGMTVGLLVRLGVAVMLCTTGCVSPTAAASGEDDRASTAARFPVPGLKAASLNPNIPTPESVIGHALGDGAVRYDEMVRFLRMLAEASPFVTLTRYAQSHEGRSLYYVTITDEANHRNLERIQHDNAKLADPRKLRSEDEANQLVEGMPGVAWLNYSIHGDELSSTDAAIQIAYQLAAGLDEVTRRLRSELVIHIDPLLNPDGRERYLAQLQHLSGKVQNSDVQAMQHAGLWSAGRGNHYLFDLNRDWLMQVQPETRGRTRAILQWTPHMMVDSHTMGSLDTYLFDPPREPLNIHLSPNNMKWRRRFSAEQAGAFDRFGWSYYTREWYEEWYPGYTNAWANLLGAIGILYEQASINASAVTGRSGEIVTYRDAVHHHVVSSFANLETLRENRTEIIRDFVADRKWAVTPERSGTQVFLVPPVGDGSRLRRFVGVLDQHGIEHGVSSHAFLAHGVVDLFQERSDRRQFPPATLIVRAAQPHRRLLTSMLDFDPRMTATFLEEERSDLENHRGSRLYDVTAWNLGMAYALGAYWADRIEDTEPSIPPKPTSSSIPVGRPAYGYLIDGRDASIFQAATRLLNRDCTVRVALKPFAVGGGRFEPGSLLLRNHENPADLKRRLEESLAGLPLSVEAAETALAEDGPDLGGQRYRLLVPPRVAIASQWPVSSTSFGAVWHLLDARVGLRVSPINLQALGALDLRRYNVLVLPPVRNMTALSAVLNDSTLERVKQWVNAGGTLVASGRTAAYLAKRDRGISQVRLKRDVLDQLDVYRDTLRRERSARRVEVNIEQVWGMPAANPVADTPAETEDNDDAVAQPAQPKDKATASKKKDKGATAREDAWRRLFTPQGAMAAADVLSDHWLCFGTSAAGAAEGRLPVLLSGEFALMAKHPVRTPVRLAPADRLRLSGLLWPEARERWADTAYATVERVGHGQVILFISDPVFRGYTEATIRLFLNAVVCGPGMGTSQPVPW